MQEIISQHINKKFGYGDLFGYKVIISKVNGYTNITKLLKDISNQLGKEKTFEEWKQLDEAKELIKFNEDSEHKSPINEVKNGKLTKGIYVSPVLLFTIASWASSSFALKISNIVNNHIINSK